MDKIINYVKHTPENTNPAVLATLLGDLNKQSDWNQNDDTQLDYVKNRPFYTGDPVETVLVEERTVSFKRNSIGLYRGEFKPTFSATDGETYKVSWDGTTYECTCIYGRYPLIGNLSITGGGSDTGEPFLLEIQQNLVSITTRNAGSHTISISIIAGEIVKINPKYLPIPFKPKGTSYLTFSSPNEFTLSVTKNWNGTLEYFASDETWTTWSGNMLLAAANGGGEYVIYLRGIGNSIITGPFNNWRLVGTDIKCIGNIENLLDYATVESRKHPIMSDHCYQYMFYGCSGLIQAPELPATTLANSCYQEMFSNSGLIQAPKLPATRLADSCYQEMFSNSGLIQAPELPATTLANSCYQEMFSNCVYLTQAPKLPATTLANSCYQKMFSTCICLTQVPELPATTLANSCYQKMFWGCEHLKLSSTKTDKYIQEYRIPSSGNGPVEADPALDQMFSSLLTDVGFVNSPKKYQTYYLSSDNMIVRETETATLNGYVNSIVDNAIEKYADTGEYIIPSSTEGSTKKFKITVDDSGAISTTEVKEVR